MPLTTKDALMERMVNATENLATNIPAKMSEYLPLSGGTITGNLEVGGNITQSGKSVVLVNASGTNYIRFENGLQICWGNLSNVAIPYTLTYPQPFKSSPSVAIDNGALYTSNWSGTSCQLVRLSGSGNAYVGYIAIGNWK